MCNSYQATNDKNFELTRVYDQKYEFLHEHHDTQSFVLHNIKEQHSCIPDHPYSSGPSSSIPDLTKCIENENPYCKSNLFDEASLLDVNAKKRKESAGCIEQELMTEIERVRRTLTLQLSDKDKEIDKLKEKLEEIKQGKTEDLSSYQYEKEDNLRDVIKAGDISFILQGSNQPQFFTWERYGLSLSTPADILHSSETCKVVITALAGGNFEFPKGSELVSAVYAISISKPLLKPLTVNIQHCVALETPEQCNSLHFVRATLNNGGLPYKFEILPGGCFTPKTKYGSISCTQFSLIGVLLGGNGEARQEENGEGQNGGAGQGENGEGEHGEGGQGENGEGQNGGVGQVENEEGQNVERGQGENGAGGHAENGVGEEQVVCEGQEVGGGNAGDGERREERAVLRISNTHNDMLYFCKVYREKEATSLWRVTFIVVKDLDALSEYIRKNHPDAFEILKLDLKLSSQKYVEFDFKKYNEKIPHGWEIIPLMDQTRLYREFIDNFGKSKQSEPSLCPVIVRHEEQSDTVRFFCYSVPVLLDDIPYVETTFYLYNTPQIVNSRLESDAHSRDPTLTGDAVKKVRKIIQDIFRENYPDLEDLLKPSLKSVAANMFACHLITNETRDKQSYNDMMTEVTFGMNLLDDVHELKKHCELFLQCLAKQGGPLNNAANSFAKKWTINIKEKLDITIEFECKM